MTDYVVSSTNLTAVANAIRTKGGTSAQLEFPQDFVDAIGAIPSGGGTYQAKTNISPDTSSQTIYPDTGYDALSSVQINAMPSGTAGTPTATKGTVSNHSVSVTPSVTNTTGYITGSTKTGTAVTVSASELVSGSETKTANGTYDVTNLAELVVNVSGGGGGSGTVPPKDVNFIDYDGTILYSYTATEAAQLTDLPANPSHTGLTAQGWNWTLTQITNQLTAMPEQPVWVGQMYTTQSGDTEIDVYFADASRRSPILTICVNGSITVDWGDNTAAVTVTGSSLETRQEPQHTYSVPGSYTIKIHVVSGEFRFWSATTALLLRKNNSGNSSRVYSNAVKAIRFGTGVTQIGATSFFACLSLETITIPKTITTISTSSLFNLCPSLKSITIPSGITLIDGSAFYNCNSLKRVSIPSSVTSFGNNAFYNCYALESITIPKDATTFGSSMFYNCNALSAISIPGGVQTTQSSLCYNCLSLESVTMHTGVKTISSSAFYGCYSLPAVTIPSSVTTISSQAFYNCYGVGAYHLKPTAPPSLSNTNAFTGIESDCVIYVPSASVSTYKSTTGWSSSSISNKIQGE